MSIQNKSLRIGLFGFGVVGESLYKVLLEKKNLNASISKICIKHPQKKRNAPSELFTTNPDALLDDPEINVIVELIDHAGDSFRIVRKALKNKKAVVSANKKMIAENLPALLSLQSEHNSPLLYEAACCASIPVIRNLEEYYDNELLQDISGIVNGSTNYILTKIAKDKIDFKTALKQAQQEGFAESDPTLDLEGHDAANKLSLLLLHAYGIIQHPATIPLCGIQKLKAADFTFAKEKGFEIKLVARALKLPNHTVTAFVLPQFINNDNRLYQVHAENNGLTIESSLADKQFFFGKGAGGFPTAAAVLSDLSALRYNYKYEYKKRTYPIVSPCTTDVFLNIYLSFEAGTIIPDSLFRNIQLRNLSNTHCYIIGTVQLSRLREHTLFKQQNVSVILMPEPEIISSEQEIPQQEAYQLV
jgi:homoserine dehydrogenase